LEPDGTFSFMLPAGRATATVFVGNPVGSFAFEVIAGEVTTLGASLGNTPPGTDVQVTAVNPDGTPSPVSMTFASVTQGGTTTVATSSSGPAEPSDFRVGTPATYFNVNTTAEFLGSFVLCINYTGISFQNESALKLFHFQESGGWVNVTSSLDTANNLICGVATSLSFFAAFEPDALDVAIDIKPGTFPNSLKVMNKDVIPVAILTKNSFNATTVNFNTVCFGDAEDVTQRDCTEAHGRGHKQDIDNDGDLDLVLHYEPRQSGIDVGDTQACLTGETFGSQKIEGCDSVRVLP
jgi:hypothetical protein